jgi:two-component system chemotaxis response regulator CheY
MPRNILIVDDSRTVRVMLRKLLTLSEVPSSEIFEASNALEALENMRATPFSLVITDLNMEGMSGIEMIDRMGEDPGLKGVDIVVVSSEGSQAVQGQLDANRVKGFVRKPFDLGNVRGILEACLA